MAALASSSLAACWPRGARAHVGEPLAIFCTHRCPGGRPGPAAANPICPKHIMIRQHGRFDHQRDEPPVRADEPDE